MAKKSTDDASDETAESGPVLTSVVRLSSGILRLLSSVISGGVAKTLAAPTVLLPDKFYIGENIVRWFVNAQS